MTLPDRSKHIMILCGEPSGDLHAGNLVKAIKKKEGDIWFSGIGGPCLKEQGVQIFFNIDKLSVMGVVEVLMQFKYIKHAFDCFKNKIKEHLPDLLILVDYPGFNLKAAQYVKERYQINILYYITPKVWAWNKKRLIKIKKYVDHAALILPFEDKIYKKANIKSGYVGNPLVDEYPENLSKPFSLLPKKQKCITIGLLPGSRQTEVKKLFEIMLAASGQIAEYLFKKNQKTVFIISKAASIKTEMIQKMISNVDANGSFKIHQGPVKDILVQSDIVIAASGTVTLEAALCCVPTIIVYKMSWLTYQLARRLVKIPYAGLANLIMDREIMPELLQNDATSEKILEKTKYLLDNQKYVVNQLQMVRTMLGSKKASESTAAIAVRMMKRQV